MNELNLREKRDTSENLNLTFKFYQQNFKYFANILLKYALPFVLISVILQSFLGYKMLTLMSSGDSLAIIEAQGYVYLSALVSFLGTVVVMIGINEFMYLYTKYPVQEITLNMVKDGMLKNALMYVVTTLVVGIITVIGFVFLVIPGIYLMIVFTIIFSIITFERADFSIAFSRCFKLMKSNWWRTLGFMIILSIVIMLLTWTISLPGILYNFSNGATGFFNATTDLDIISLTLNGLSSIFITLFIHPLSIIGISVLYLSYVEKKENIGLRERIQDVSPDEV